MQDAVERVAVVAVDLEGKLWHWNKGEARLFHRFPGVQANTGFGGNLAILPDGKTMILDRGGVHVWNLKSAKEAANPPMNPRGVGGARYFPDLSPDEQALTCFAQSMGFELYSRSGNRIRLRITNRNVSTSTSSSSFFVTH